MFFGKNILWNSIDFRRIILFLQLLKMCILYEDK